MPDEIITPAQGNRADYAHNLGKILPKTIDAMMLVQAGLSPLKALQATNKKEDICERTVYKLKEKIRKHSLTAPKTVKLAHDVITDILEGKPQVETHSKVGKDGQVVVFTDEVMPTWSNRATIALAVYDRYEPVKGQAPEQGAGNTYIDLSSYQVAISVDKPVDK